MSQNGSKIGTKIRAKAEKKRKKGGPKIDAKKGCQKKVTKVVIQDNPGSPEGPFWSRRGGKEGTSPSGNRRIRI